MKKTLLILAAVFAFGASVRSQSLWEITWDFYGVRHQALLYVDNDNTGFMRVNCWNMYNGVLIDVVDQYVKTRSVYDGVIINCYNPRSTMYNFTNYSADNFKIFNNGAMYMQDDMGNWSTAIVMYAIPEYQWASMRRKYGL
ncbi:MAG: hypothetical protein FWC39_10980 [Bacteroidetes bacterium]|nr:hypothetical protein [Bacteroidota bacterium]